MKVARIEIGQLKEHYTHQVVRRNSRTTLGIPHREGQRLKVLKFDELLHG